MIEQNKKYELDYWLKHTKEKATSHFKTIFDIIDFNLFRNCKWAADLGSGPYGGVFEKITFPVMYAVDPLWPEYEKCNLLPKNENVIRITGNSINLKLPHSVDCIFTINAIDHSGNFFVAMNNIFLNLNHGGYFVMHVHLRNKNQINAGHKMIITKRHIEESALRLMTPIVVNYYDHCPISSDRNMKSVIGIWKKLK